MKNKHSRVLPLAKTKSETQRSPPTKRPRAPTRHRSGWNDHRPATRRLHAEQLDLTRATELGNCNLSPSPLENCRKAPSHLENCRKAPLPLKNYRKAPLPLKNCRKAPLPLENCIKSSSPLKITKIPLHLWKLTNGPIPPFSGVLFLYLTFVFTKYAHITSFSTLQSYEG